MSGSDMMFVEQEVNIQKVRHAKAIDILARNNYGFFSYMEKEPNVFIEMYIHRETTNLAALYIDNNLGTVDFFRGIDNKTTWEEVEKEFLK